MDIIGIDIGEGKDWWCVHGLATHEKVYELNKQMCDIGKTMSDPMESLSEDTERAMLGCCELLAKDASDAKLVMDDIVRRAEENIMLYNDNNKYARFVRACYESKFGKPKEKDIMEEKKTKTMTKAEAFEWLKCKKVDTIGLGEEVQKKLFDCGVKWSNGKCEYYDFGDYLLIESDGYLYHCGSCGDAYFKMHHFEEIYAHDILSMEIIDENKSEEEKALDKISYLGSQIVDILLRMKGRHHVTITETTVALHGEGICLFHSDPF